MTDKTCTNCKHYQKPDGEHIRTTWCDNPASPNSQQYVYKGDTCDEFAGKRGKKRKVEKPAFVATLLDGKERGEK